MVLGLVEPESSGIGGGAFLLHWSAKEKKLRSYDGRETAPAAAKPDRFLKDGKPMAFLDAAVGGRSVGVPGVLRMLELAHQRHGRLPWAELFGAAIRVAEEGFDAAPKLRAAAGARAPCARIRPRAGSTTRAAGIINREYAETLRAHRARRRATRSTRATSRATSCARCARMRKPGDLTERGPRATTARSSASRCAAPYRELAHLLDGAAELGRHRRAADPRHPRAHRASRARRRSRPQALHLFAEAGRLAYADRARYLGDPAFVAVPDRSAC